MKLIQPAFLGLLLFTLAGCKQKTDSKAEGEKLMQVSREWSKTAASRDIEKTMNYWADDAILISAGESLRTGKKAIRQMVEQSLANPGFQISWEPQKAEVSENGDMGYLTEITTITVNDSVGKPLAMKYNSLSIWKKQADGSWKNVVDVLSPEK
jgi:uncharacterized protein (TIGR02246 family)